MTIHNTSHYQDFSNLDQWLYYLENLHSSEIDMGLTRISQVAERLAIDISFATVITVAGTNGKGTTCAFIENALLSDFAGNSKKNVAVYSSPHIDCFNERLRINKHNIDDQPLIEAFKKIEIARQDISLTYYEYTTLAALLVLMDEMPDVLAKMANLENKLKNVEGDISGELRVTTVSSFSPVITPSLKAFRSEYPKIRLNLISTDNILPLDTGAAHVSFRAGPKPTSPDLIVKNLTQLTTAYYATQDYVDKFGQPQSVSDFNDHQWVLPTPEKYRIPFVNYIVDKIDNHSIVFQSNHYPDIQCAVIAGMGIGPLGQYQAGLNPAMIKMNVNIPKKDEVIWFVYHKDLKHSARIRCFYEFLKEHCDNNILR
jgi:DNA-binding transcriptional LysR family regulator